MSKSKYNTIKELPFAWYEVDALEAWLDEQAQQGLRLTDIQGKLCVFQPSDKPPARYRVHVKPHNGYYTQQEEYKETMRELGWEYVGRINYHRNDDVAWQEVTIDGWDQAMYRRYTTSLRQEFRSDWLPDTPEMSQQELVLRLGNRVVTVGYTGEADMYSRLNTLYARRTTAGATT